MLCPSCGGNVPNDARFCASCGEPIAANYAAGEDSALKPTSMPLTSIATVVAASALLGIALSLYLWFNGSPLSLFGSKGDMAPK